MSNTTPVDRRALTRCLGMVAAAALACGSAAAQSHEAKESVNMTVQHPAADTLGAQQQAILPVAAFAAAGDMGKLDTALSQGLDAGPAISAAREVLVQLYAYAGFLRSLNVLTAVGNAPARRWPRR